MVTAMCVAQLKDRKTLKDFMLMLDSNATIDQLAMANSVHWQSQVPRREYDHVVRREDRCVEEGMEM